MRATGTTSRVTARVVAIAAALGVSALLAPSRAAAQDSGTVAAPVAAQSARAIATERVAQQLGAKLANAQPPDLVIGSSATAILSDPARLAALGLRDAKAGARVTFLRSAHDRVRVEVDEFDPVARTRRLALRLDADGRLSAGTP